MVWSTTASSSPVSNRRHLASGTGMWCDLCLDVAGGGGPVTNSVVEAVASPKGLTWEVDEARLWLASLQAVRP
jgi:hypothetical protein